MSTLTETPSVIDSLAGVDDALQTHKQIQQSIDHMVATHDANVSRMKALLDADIAPLRDRQATLERQASAYLTTNRRWLIRHHGKVIELAHGTVAFRVIADALKAPKNVNDAVAYLLRRRNGRRYLSAPVYKLDAKAIVSADRRVRRELAPFGIGIRRRENLTFKPEGYKDPVVLHERPLKQKPPRSGAKA